MPTYKSPDFDKSALPKADYKVYAKEIPEGVEPKTVSVDFKTKPVAWLYKNAKGGIYGTIRLVTPDGKEHRWKIYLSENNYSPATAPAPQHEALQNGGPDPF